MVTTHALWYNPKPWSVGISTRLPTAASLLPASWNNTWFLVSNSLQTAEKEQAQPDDSIRCMFLKSSRGYTLYCLIARRTTCDFNWQPFQLHLDSFIDKAEQRLGDTFSIFYCIFLKYPFWNFQKQNIKKLYTFLQVVNSEYSKSLIYKQHWAGHTNMK